MTLDTEAITARYYDEPDPFFPGERTVVIPRPAEVLRDIAALLAEVARLREALEQIMAAGQCCEAANVGKPHDSECVARAALQAVEET
jgi:hypothetical protein